MGLLVRALIVAALLGIMTVGCSPMAAPPTPTAPAAPSPTPSGRGQSIIEPTPQPPSTVVSIIDWADFLKVDGITYMSTGFGRPQVGRPLEEKDLGPEFAKVKFKLEGNVSDPGYQAKDGDAAFLDAGTPVYEVKGYKPQFRLAARCPRGRMVPGSGGNGTGTGTGICLYEAEANPRARTGADLLDIGQKVRYIGVNSHEDDKIELGAIKDPVEVSHLVDMVLQAPVDQNFAGVGEGGPWYFIVFHMEDDTVVSRAYSLGYGEMVRGIMLPKEFGEAIRKAIK